MSVNYDFHSKIVWRLQTRKIFINLDAKSNKKYTKKSENLHQVLELCFWDLIGHDANESTFHPNLAQVFCVELGLNDV